MCGDFLRQKVQLVLGGDVRIPEGYDNPLFEHRDGEPYSLVMVFGDCRVRKKISSDGEFSLVPNEGGFDLLRNGEPFLSDICLKEMFNHSPDIAVITLGKEDRVLTASDVMKIIGDFEMKMILRGITLHAGKGCTREHYLEVVRSVRWWYQKLSIGVGAQDFSPDDMRAFHDGGANNFKATIQTPVQRIQSVLDPAKPVSEYVAYLEDAVSVFGKNNVVCTMYIGLGETDGEFLESIDLLCSKGVMPDIKVKKSRDKTRAAVMEKLGDIEPVTPERYESLLRKTKEIMEKYGLDPFGFNTLCYGCRLCTIVPIREF